MFQPAAKPTASAPATGAPVPPDLAWVPPAIGTNHADRIALSRPIEVLFSEFGIILQSLCVRLVSRVRGKYRLSRSGRTREHWPRRPAATPGVKTRTRGFVQPPA